MVNEDLFGEDISSIRHRRTQTQQLHSKLKRYQFVTVTVNEYLFELVSSLCYVILD